MKALCSATISVLKFVSVAKTVGATPEDIRSMYAMSVTRKRIMQMGFTDLAARLFLDIAIDEFFKNPETLH